MKNSSFNALMKFEKIFWNVDLSQNLTHIRSSQRHNLMISNNKMGSLKTLHQQTKEKSLSSCFQMKVYWCSYMKNYSQIKDLKVGSLFNHDPWLVLSHNPKFLNQSSWLKMGLWSLPNTFQNQIELKQQSTEIEQDLISSKL